MSVASKKRLLEELQNKKFRDAYAAEHVKTSLPIQIYTLREQRGLSQSQLAERAKTTQTVISRLEDPDYGNFTIASLLKIASALDVALLVKFVPFTRLLKEFEDVSPAALAATAFTEELLQLVAWANEEAKEKSADAALSGKVTTQSTGYSPEAEKWSEIQDLLNKSNWISVEHKSGLNEAIQEPPARWSARRIVPDYLFRITEMRLVKGINPKINMPAEIAGPLIAANAH